MLDADNRREPLLAARRDRDAIAIGVGRLDADHAVILLVAEVGQAPGLLDPRIPDNGAVAAGLGDRDPATESWIFDRACLGRVQIDSIGLRCNRDRAML